MKLNKLSLLLIVISFCFCTNKKKQIQITANDYHNVVNKLTTVIIHDVFSPPVASRIYAYPNIAAYEALNIHSKKYKSLTNQLNDLKPYPFKEDIKTNYKLSAIIAYLDVAKELVFTKKEIIKYRDSLYNKWSKINSKDFHRAKKQGLKISSHVIKWMNKDNYIETRSMPEFNINSNTPGRWQPTPPGYMEGIEPHWNKIRSFTLDSASQYKPTPPPLFSMNKNSSFYKELIEVYNIKKELEIKGDKSEQIAIARFWDCNPYVSVNKGHFMFAEKKITPGAHWISITNIACKKAKKNFEETIYANTKTSIAISDAFISCWDEKYRSNLVRPETLINKYIDESWEPILQTPPFPEYTSGHSVVSGAASTVLTSIFGDNFSYEDTTEVQFGLPVRKFNSFKHASQEAAISRLYGGIHYKAAIDFGLTQGNNIGDNVNTSLSFFK